MAILKDSLITGDLRVTGTIYGDVPLNDLVDADDLKAIEALTGTSGLLKKTAANTWTLDTTAYKTGTVTSVRVQATSPVVSSVNTAQTSTLNTTISLADNYGDTKNPYASKTARYVLAAPASAAGAPTFRALTNADVGLSNVENTKLSTWTGSSNITTIGTLSSGTVPWARLSNVPSASTSAAGIIQIGTGATNAAAGNHNHDSTYVAVAGDTMTGALLVGTKAMTVSAGKITEIGNGQTGLFKDGIAISNPTTKNDAGWIRVTGTGESDTVMEIATGDDAGAGEKIVARQYNTSNAVANELVLLNTDGGTVIPKRLTMTSGKPINQILTGSGTAAKDNGASASPRYTPAKWTFNTGLTVSDGDIFTIKIPVAGHTYGIYMSVNNGTNYYPVVANGTGRVTTHYPVNNYIQVIFEASGSAASMTPLAGADAANGSTITGGVFRVLNYYDANTTYSAMSVAEMKTGTATSSRVIRADYLKTFLSTLGGTALTLTHDATNGLVLNHDNYATAGTVGTSSATNGITLAVPYVTYNAQGHITATGTHTHTIPDASTSAKGVIQIGTGASNAAAGNHAHGNITTDGKVGTAADKAVYTTTGGAVTAGTLPIAAGGTGKTTAADAWTALGGGASGKHADSYFAKASHGNHVPTTQTANNAVFLRNDNTWQTVTPANIGAATSGHTHTTSLASDTGTSTITLASAGKYKLTAGGTSVIFTMPTSNNYSHPTSAGNRHIPSGGESGQLLKYGGSSGTAAWTTFTTNTPTAVTKKTVVTSATVSNEILTISTGDSVTVTAGTAASFS